jgi:sulfatase modifying factor 1
MKSAMGQTLLICTTIAAIGPSAPVSAAPAQSAPSSRPAPTTDMVLIPGGTFSMGSSAAHGDEVPVHAVTLKAFLLDRYEVTNRQFAAFVEATGFVTQAERDGAAWCYLKGEADFRYVEGADWRHPEGPGSSVIDRTEHPVVCVSWHDAHAYANWAGKRLPTEAEWEYAARSRGGPHVAADPQVTAPAAPHAHVNHGDGSGQRPHEATAEHPSSRGHQLVATPTSRPASDQDYVAANIWQGVWPSENRLTDGFFSTAPVGSFESSPIGVHDMIGNVWEWTADWYGADFYRDSPAGNPTGPSGGETRVARGGSWFCSANYCGAYNSHYRGASPPDHAFNNVGFRCAADAPARALIGRSSTEAGR